MHTRPAPVAPIGRALGPILLVLGAVLVLAAFALSLCRARIEPSSQPSAARSEPGFGERPGSPGAEPGAASQPAPPLEAPPPVPEGGPEKLALIVGIDEYAPGTSSRVPALRGCRADAQRARTLLVERFGFAPEDVLVLLDAQATLEGIVRAFESHLLRRAGPRTEVLVWFSGHGSQVPDRSGTELGELDGSLLAYDSRAGERAGEYDLSDDLLASLRTALCERTSRVTFVTDACHSGGGTRGAGGGLPLRVRGVARGSRPLEPALLRAFWPRWVPLLDDDDRRRAQQDYVHIAACAPDELARELDLEEGAHGALSFFLADALERAQPGTSYRELAERAAAEVGMAVPAQTVWSEGDLERVLFGARFVARPPGIPARLVRPGLLSLNAGSLLGLREGSELALFGDDPARELGRARVERVTSCRANAAWSEPPADEQALLGRALRALERSRPGGSEPLPVCEPEPELAALLAGSELVELVPRGASGYALVRGAEDGLLRLSTPEGLVVWRQRELARPERGEAASAASAGERQRELQLELEAALRAELRYRALLALSRAEGVLRTSARFVPPPEELLEYWWERKRFVDAEVHELRDPHGAAAGKVWGVRGAREDENPRLANLRVDNLDARPVYVAVISFSEDRACNLVFPVGDQRDRVLRPGESLDVPVNVLAGKGWTLARPMHDRYLVIATPEYADFGFLEHGGGLRGAEAGPSAPLPGLIEDALRGPRTRGERRSLEAPDWGLTSVELLVE